MKTQAIVVSLLLGSISTPILAHPEQEARIAALEAKLAAVTNVTVNGQPTVRFSGVNVQIVNGVGATASKNARGNLLLGYDLARNDDTYFCSEGDHLDDQYNDANLANDCSRAGGIWAVSHKTGSHYLVVGDYNNYSQIGGVVVGAHNTSNGGFASVLGGWFNTASGAYSIVTGGSNNTARGFTSSVSGGYENTAWGQTSSVGGGLRNTARGYASSVSGGRENTASGGGSTVSGGYRNTTSNSNSSCANNAGVSYSTVSGGSRNTASGCFSTVSGGSNRSAVGEYDWVGGGLFQDY